MSVSNIFEQFPVLDLDDDYYLREQTISDTEDFFNYYSKDEVSKYILANIPQTINEAIPEIEYWINLYRKKVTIYWAIAKKSDNKMIGAIGLNDWDRYHNRAEISYDLDSDYWNKGIVTKAIKLITKFAFEEMKINRIQASTLEENLGSIKVLEKAHFSLDGKLKSYRFHQGKYYDIMMYSLTYKEWQTHDK